MGKIQREVIMEKATKKVDQKAVVKAEIMDIIEKALTEKGFTFRDGVEFGMTKGTIVVESPVCDVQIKPITPKAGVIRYDLVKTV